MTRDLHVRVMGRDFAFARSSWHWRTRISATGLIARLRASRLYLRQSNCNETEGGELLAPFFHSLAFDPPRPYHRSQWWVDDISSRMTRARNSSCPRIYIGFDLNFYSIHKSLPREKQIRTHLRPLWCSHVLHRWSLKRSSSKKKYISTMTNSFFCVKSKCFQRTYIYWHVIKYCFWNNSLGTPR